MRPYYYLGDNRALTQLAGGQPFFVNTRDHSISPWIIMGGTWENFVDDILCALARPGDTFFDVGAHQGYYTVKVGSIVGATGRVFSFEPNPEVFPFLRENIRINGMSEQAAAFEVAAGDAPGKAALAGPAHHPGGGTLSKRHRRPETLAQKANADTVKIKRTVAVRRIDDIMPTDIVADLIKVDVEGFEPAALRGMRKILARSPQCAIVCEIDLLRWPAFGDPAAMVREFASDRRIFKINHDGGMVEYGDHLIDNLSPDDVNYALFLPHDAERNQQVERFIRSPA